MSTHQPFIAGHYRPELVARKRIRLTSRFHPPVPVRSAVSLHSFFLLPVAHRCPLPASLPAPHQEERMLARRGTVTVKERYELHRRQRGGPWGGPSALGASAWMSEQYHAVDLATGARSKPRWAITPHTTGRTSAGPSRRTRARSPRTRSWRPTRAACHSIRSRAR